MTWSTLRQALAALLVDGADQPAGGADPSITGVAYDSRRVTPGQVFVALQGRHADGLAFVAQALARGAVVVVAEQAAPDDALRGVWVRVQNSRLALALLADAFYQHPSRELRVVGITGTNGKTTTAFLMASIFDAAGQLSGLVGTVGYRIGREMREAVHTTPEAPDVQALLREMVKSGCTACAMEVSSHALSRRRVDGTRFAAAIFTNLTRDHLDFHGDMESYFQAKRRLFELLPPDAPGLINADDPRAAQFRDACRRPVTYGISRPADISPGPLAFSLEGLVFDARTPRGTIRVRSPLVGRPNVYNILAAVAAATALDLPLDAIERGIAALRGVPGRFEIVATTRDGVTVVVDYAHTDDALRNLLETARPLARGRLITVFGCGGDRDRTKRPLMGAVAARLSDVVIVTSDNPRSEDPGRIIDEVLRGITPDTRRDGRHAVVTLVDRRAAIEKAVELARAGDVVLIAGKGHEKYQLIGGATLPFDDVVVARDALGHRPSNSGVA